MKNRRATYPNLGALIEDAWNPVPKAAKVVRKGGVQVSHVREGDLKCKCGFKEFRLHTVKYATESKPRILSIECQACSTIYQVDPDGAVEDASLEPA